MTKTDLQLGGGYKYQWECAILLALNYLYEKSLDYNPTLHGLLTGFLGSLAEIQLEGIEKNMKLSFEGDDLRKDRELEDINLIAGEKRILVQVKTKEAEGKLWTLTDDLLLKALYKFYQRYISEDQPGNTCYVFLSNRDFNSDLQNVIKAIQKGILNQLDQKGDPTEVGKLHRYLSTYMVKEKKSGKVDFNSFCGMLIQTSFVFLCR